MFPHQKNLLEHPKNNWINYTWSDQVFSSHYYTMRAHFDCRLLYSDMDSLLFKIRSREIYEQLVSKTISVFIEFDFSNHPKDHCLYSTENKLVVLKLTDSFTGDFVTEFVCLKPNYTQHSQKESIHCLF